LQRRDQSAFWASVAGTGCEDREDAMEEFLQALGTVGFVILLVAGVLAGLIASMLEGGRNKPRNIAIGVIGALLLPFVAAVAAAGALAAGGLLLIVFLALVGAVVVLLIAHLILR
jgi:uncharacterized membrane protein YeaQ/YmgE (transglycosylase-associated protein family)